MDGEVNSLFFALSSEHIILRNMVFWLILILQIWSKNDYTLNHLYRQGLSSFKGPGLRDFS